MTVEADSTVQSPQPQEPEKRGAWRRKRALVFFTIGVVISLVLAMILFGSVGKKSANAAADQVAPGISSPAASLLQLGMLSTSASVTPANFTLTDQYGNKVSLRKYLGKVVVLSFNDDQCPDLCTLLAQDIVVANHDLGAMAKDVVFLSVNVNPFYPQVRYVKSWTDSHGLGNQPNWVFTTGSVSQLHKVWKDYGTSVQADNLTKTVTHSTEMFFIDPSGHERAVGAFGTNAANTSLYAHDMAQVAADLLPKSLQKTVGGPKTLAPSQSDSAVGSQGPEFTLPSIAKPSQSVSLASLRGHYAVLNFWASTCTACVSEMPSIEAAYKSIGSKADFLGIAVSDSTSAAKAFAKKVGVTYPLVSDSKGLVSGAYDISGLPFTVIIGPSGKILVRHPGVITTEQLTYLLENLSPNSKA